MAALQPGCGCLHAHPRPRQVCMHTWGRGVGKNCSKRLQAVRAALADGKPSRPATPDMARWLPWLFVQRRRGGGWRQRHHVRVSPGGSVGGHQAHSHQGGDALRGPCRGDMRLGLD